MATQEEIIRLNLQVQGQAEAEALRQKMAQLREQIATLGATAGAASPRMIQLGTSLQQAGMRLESLERQFGRAGAGISQFHNKLQGAAFLLDDLQYVGEQGLRPILNNLAMISPAAFMFALAGDQVYKHWSEVSGLGKGVFNYWTEGLGETTAAAEGLAKSFGNVGEFIQAAAKQGTTFFAAMGEGFDAMGGGKGRREQASIDAFTKGDSGRSEEDKAKGKAMVDAIQKYGPARALEEMALKRSETDPSLRAVNANGEFNDPKKFAERNREEKARVVGLIERAKGGDTNAIDSLNKLTQGTGVGQKIAESSPQAIMAAKIKEQSDKDLVEAAKKHEKDLEETRNAKRRTDGMGDEMVAGFRRGEESDRDKFVKDRQGRYNAGQRNAEMEATRLFGPDGARMVGKDLAKGFEDAVKAEMMSRPGLSQEQAAAAVRDRAANALLNPNRSDAEKRALSREGAFEQHLGDISGIDNPIAMRMYQARFMGRGSMNDLNMQRRLSRMTLAEREQYQARRNDASDAQNVEITTRQLMMSGVTRDPRQARAIAMARVAEQRQAFNGLNGDPATKAQENTVKSLDQLREAIVTQTQNGVKLVLD